MVVNNSMMDNEAMANAAGQGKQPTVTPTVQAETQDDSSRKRTKSQRAEMPCHQTGSLSNPDYLEVKGQLV